MKPTLALFGVRAISEVAVAPQPLKRAQFGLFQGKTKQYGNNVPFSLRKTRRTWLPNVQRKRLFSETLQSHVQVKVTTAALKTIKKAISIRAVVCALLNSLQKGGVDNYVQQTSADLLGWRGMKIRLMIREAQEKNASETASAPKRPARSKLAPLRAPVPDPIPTLKALANPGIAASFVRYTRRMAAKAAGNKGFASAKDTIEYIKQQKN
ncbi:50S ribosomal protein L24 [Roridomyces roridus]|uniref:Large ribosomal subunit protein bL28c n=1 Tax=Roridomyces roridus TaxID=1738132 RepID=A0AAD7CFT1_9AGAR|nr:50S ribosomal protein L24 [Roridomyces roridus]